MKNVLIRAILLCVIASWLSCKDSKVKTGNYLKSHGKTMGTTYNLTYESSTNLKPQVDSILLDINKSVSTYIPTSTISILNNDSLGVSKNNQTVYHMAQDDHFLENFNQSNEIYQKTNGFFDPSIMPLVNYWGFGYKKKQAVTRQDTFQISQLRQMIGLDKWQVEIVGDSLNVRKHSNAELDFSGIAKGYAVDYIAAFFNKQDITNYFVEIGGEVFTSGKNPNGNEWTIGLSKPEISAGFNDYQALVTISNKGMASSGNYRNYYTVNGITYGHEINPKTGFPEVNKLLGTTVIAESCAIADAYATAFMVMGLEESELLLTTLPNIHASLFYREEDGSIGTKQSKGFEAFIKK